MLCQCHDFYSDVPVVVEKLYVEQQMKIVNWGRMVVCKKEWHGRVRCKMVCKEE